MAHKEQRDFIKSVKEKHIKHFDGGSVLDVGSCDLNGNNREYFSNSKYIGLDIMEGPNVDVACPVHKYKPDEKYSVVISTECLEHDMHYRDSILSMVELTDQSGLFVFTCATTGRAEHGTRRTTPSDSLTSKVEGSWSDYYKNLVEEDIREVIDVDEIFSDYEFSTHKGHKDLYFWGIKKCLK